jgi:hypothetical protein
MLKIDREKRQSLLGHVEVEYRLGLPQKGSDATPLVRVIASQYGVSIAGQVSGQDELERLAEMVGHGWADHLNLKPRLSTTIAGH